MGRGCVPKQCQPSHCACDCPLPMGQYTVLIQLQLLVTKLQKAVVDAGGVVKSPLGPEAGAGLTGECGRPLRLHITHQNCGSQFRHQPPEKNGGSGDRVFRSAQTLGPHSCTPKT